MTSVFRATAAAAGIAVALFAGGCATHDTLRLMRQPALPPVAVPKASPYKDYYKNISIQEVDGAPEFRWFDGNGVITTRPTRVQILQFLTHQLADADLLAPNRVDSEYMLHVKFDELKGPDVWLFTDKLASARVTFRLVRWRTGQGGREKTYQASYLAKFPGIPPEVARSAIAGPIGVSRDAEIAPIGGAIGGAGYFFALNEISRVHAVARVAHVWTIQGDEIWENDKDIYRMYLGKPATRLTDFEALLAGGLLGAVADGVRAEETMPVGATDDQYVDGTKRRNAATLGLLNLLLDQFLNDLSKDGQVVFKTAVSCSSLNPGSYRYNITETADAVGVDCPGASYFVSQSFKRRPAPF